MDNCPSKLWSCTSLVAGQLRAQEQEQPEPASTMDAAACRHETSCCHETACLHVCFYHKTMFSSAKVKEELLPDPEEVFSPSTAEMIRQLDDSADARVLVAQLYQQALLNRHSVCKWIDTRMVVFAMICCCTCMLTSCFMYKEQRRRKNRQEVKPCKQHHRCPALAKGNWEGQNSCRRWLKHRPCQWTPGQPQCPAKFCRHPQCPAKFRRPRCPAPMCPCRRPLQFRQWSRL